jgi:hypothetical protein
MKMRQQEAGTPRAKYSYSIGDWQMQVQGTRYKVQGTRYKVQGTRYKVQGTRYKVQGTRYKVQGTRTYYPEVTWWLNLSTVLVLVAREIIATLNGGTRRLYA